MIGWRRAAATATSRLDARSARGMERRAGRLAAAERWESLAAPLFAVAMLLLAMSLTLWAPWRDEGPATISDYAPRVEPRAAEGTSEQAVTPATATAVLATVAPAAAPAAATAVPAGEPDRPLGLPVQRGDWVILRDYAAHGGPGPNGAIDIAVEANREAVGTPIYATHEGTVRVLRNNRRYGNLVAVKNGRWSTTYGHLDQVLVSDGQIVRRGEQVGTLGATGNATSPHVDYQVWEKMDNVELNRNPMDFIEPR